MFRQSINLNIFDNLNFRVVIIVHVLSKFSIINKMCQILVPEEALRRRTELVWFWETIL